MRKATTASSRFPSLIRSISALAVALTTTVGGASSRAEDFRDYVLSAKDFQRTKRSPTLLGSERWDRWVLIPWRYNWGRDYDADLALKLNQAGFNGAMCDYAPDEADIHERAGFLWYLDHAAGKGDLYLRPEHATRDALRAPDRPVCLADSVVRARLMDKLTESVAAASEYGHRIAYALDDEISWSSFTNPCRWDNSPSSLAGFHGWLIQRYGSREAIMNQWGPGAERFWDRLATPDDFQTLYRRPWPEWNLSPWADAISYMDSQLCNLIGDLVERSNAIDPAVPAGIVGGQCPAPYGGYDYAKLMRKVQFLEAYDLGCSAEIVRSLNPGNNIPLVKTSFGDPLSAQNHWLRWHHLIHGDRGEIAWAENWFREDGVPAERVFSLGAEIQRLAHAAEKIDDARWMHDGVAVYYSHPSIQASWFIDCQPHGDTWINRSGSINDRLATTVGTFWAWAKLLEDAGIQYNFFSYADLLEHGIDPQEYRVLILPHALALSEAEAAEMTRYVRAGGHLIADHAPGWFDQHLRGRSQPILDDLFGIEDHPVAGPGKLFGGLLLAEIDAERHWDKNFVQAAAKMWNACRRQQGFVVAERDLPAFIDKSQGEGRANLMNISVIEYAFLRTFDPPEAAQYRAPIVRLLRRAGVVPWVDIERDGRRPARTEITYWQHEDRVVVCVARNPLVLGQPPAPWEESMPPGKRMTLKVIFSSPKRNVVNELTGEALGDGFEFEVEWLTCEAAMVSFEK